MIYGQPKTAKISKTIEIIEQAVQKMTYGQPKIVKIFETVKIVKSSETGGVYTLLLSCS